MKKYLIVLMLAVIAGLHTNAQARFGITAGAVFANYKVDVDGFSVSSDPKTGITAGMFVDLPLSKSLSFQPALNYVQKGSTWKLTDFGETITSKAVVHNIEVPLNLVFHTGGLFIGAGPSFCLGVSGKSTMNDGSGEVKESIKFGNGDEDDMRPLDLGANLMAGYLFTDRFLVSGHYNAGLSNLAPGSGDAGKLKSSYFGVKLGLMFGH